MSFASAKAAANLVAGGITRRWFISAVVRTWLLLAHSSKVLEIHFMSSICLLMFTVPLVVLLFTDILFGRVMPTFILACRARSIRR